MFLALTMILAVAGAGVLAVGVRGLIRRRRAERSGAGGPGRGAGWPSAVAMGAGALVLLLPDAAATAIVGAPSGHAGLWGVAGVLYRIIVLAWLGVLTGGLWLTRNRVVVSVTGARDRVLRVAHSLTDPEVRALRRTDVGKGMPRDLATLVRYEVHLGERLMGYQRDPDRAYDRPAMVDLADPVTAAAWEAMFRAEELRPAVPRPSGRDALASEYGHSVIALANAVSAAERHAGQLVHAGMSEDERAIVMDAERILAFLREHAASPAERARAYEELLDRLQAARSTARSEGEQQGRSDEPGAQADPPPTPSPATGPNITPEGQPRAHPWLEVSDRAGRSTDR